jgi:hypothetical protein
MGKSKKNIKNGSKKDDTTPSKQPSDKITKADKKTKAPIKKQDKKVKKKKKKEDKKQKVEKVKDKPTKEKPVAAYNYQSALKPSKSSDDIENDSHENDKLRSLMNVIENPEPIEPENQEIPENKKGKKKLKKKQKDISNQLDNISKEEQLQIETQKKTLEDKQQAEDELKKQAEKEKLKTQKEKGKIEEKDKKKKEKGDRIANREKLKKKNKVKLYKKDDKLPDKIKKLFLHIKLLFLGRTKKQTRLDKPSFMGKKMLGIFIVFVFYAFVLFSTMTTTEDSGWYGTLINYLCLGNPYFIGIALTFTFFELSILFSNEVILEWTFRGKPVIKQGFMMVSLILLNFLLARFIDSKNLELYSLLLIMASIWLLWQSVRLYSGSRDFATRLETKWISRYSGFRYFLALVMPFVILGFLTFIAWGFRYYAVLLTLDFLGTSTPDIAFNVYELEMNIVMPMIYIGLILIFIFMIIQTILTRNMGDTKRSGAFDNLSFALVTFMMFFYALYNIALFLFLDPDTTTAIGIALGNTEQSSYLFVFEFAFSIFFLLWIISDLTKQFQTGFLFFTNDGLVMFMIGTVMAQTTARLGLTMEDVSGTGSAIAEVITYDRLILPFVIILFLGVTILIYYLKPQETSMFLRMNKAAVDEQDKSMETILKFLKREFIRRGEKYQISKNLIAQLRQITALSAGIIWSLIKRIDNKYMDIMLLENQGDNDEKMVYIDFIPITEKYQSDKGAEKKANKFMTDRFSNLIYKTQRKRMNLTKKKLTSSKQSDVFIQALSVSYGRKIKDEAAIKQSQEEDQLIIDKAIDEDTKFLIYKIIQNEYIRRIRAVTDFPEFRFKISEIATRIEETTRVSVGTVFPLIDTMAQDNWNLRLFDVSDEDADGYDDKLIEFVPVDDFDIYDALVENRPEELDEIHMMIRVWFEDAIYYKRKKLVNLPKLIYEDEDEEFQRSYRSKLFAEMMEYFDKNYATLTSEKNLKGRAVLLKRAVSNIHKGMDAQRKKNEDKKKK